MEVLGILISCLLIIMGSLGLVGLVSGEYPIWVFGRVNLGGSQVCSYFCPCLWLSLSQSWDG